jgi:hypothetical protein
VYSHTERAEKSLLSKPLLHKIGAGEKKRAALEPLRIQKHQQNSTPKRLTTILSIQYLFTLAGARHNPEASS